MSNGSKDDAASRCLPQPSNIIVITKSFELELVR